MICPEKYYLCGLMAACGELYQGRGEAKLSFDFGDWGDIEKSPGNAVSLTRDFISTLGPKFLEFYKLNLDVQESSSNWYAKLSGDLSLLICRFHESWLLGAIFSAHLLCRRRTLGTMPQKS